MARIELDFGDVPAEGSIPGVKINVITMNGPAGGNPLVELTGERSAIEKYIADEYAGDGEPAEFYNAMIVES